MPAASAKPVVDTARAFVLLGQEAAAEPEVKEQPAGFYNPHSHLTMVEVDDVRFWFGPGHNTCSDPELAEKLKSVAAIYGIQVL
jgi:hypothetical protein